MEYHIKKTENKHIAINDKIWSEIKAAEISCCPWEGYRTGIKTTVKAVYTDTDIILHFETNEKPLFAVKNHINDSVCEDSCMEFFFRAAGSGSYINIEINPLGVSLIEAGSPGSRNPVPAEENPVLISSMIDNKHWTLQYAVPFSFAEKYTGKLFPYFYGNFYKCGDKTEHPHYACWHPIVSDRPNFHMPDQFGKLILD